MKRPIFWLAPAAGALIFSLLAPSVSADTGYASFSLWNRSLLYRDPWSGRPGASETIVHFEAVQNVTNYGSISLLTDALYAGGAVRFSRLSAAWTGLTFLGASLAIRLGDDNLINTNLESRFVNQYHPYLYFRGFSAALAASRFDLSAFGGKAARLSGLLGSSYEIDDQPLFGLKGRWRPGPGWIIGTGVIHTRPDLSVIPVGAGPVSKKNTLLMFDAEGPLAPGIKVLGEFRTSLTPDESPSPGAANALRFGPLIRTGKWDVEANYRFSGSRFQEVNREAQIGRDERGLFSSVRYQAAANFSLFTFVDRRSNNTGRDPGLNTIRAWSVISGLHFNTRSLLNLTAQWELQDRVSENPLSGNVRYGSNGVFLQASKTLGRYFPYLRLRLTSARDVFAPVSRAFIPSIYAGFRKLTGSGASLWVEGQFEQKSMLEMNEAAEDPHPDPERIISDRTIALRTGWSRSLSPNLDLYTELFYERYGHAAPFAQAVAYIGVRIGLPKDLDLRIDLRASEPLNQRGTRSSNYQINLRFDKRFSWGQPPKILGRSGIGAEAVAVGTVDGFVFEDRDGNGIPGPGETGIPKIALRLEDGSRTETGADGRYRFDNVAEGPHQIRVEANRIPAVFYLLSPDRVNVLVQPRQITQVSFPLISGADYRGRILDDVNRNGQADPEDTGSADVLVILAPVASKDRGGGPSPAEAGLTINTYTDSQGRFSFVNVFPGEYDLMIAPETLPTGVSVSVPLPVRITLAPGQPSTDNLFLIAPRPVIRKK